MRYVLIPKFCEATGYSEKAVRRKIEDGVWILGHQYRRAPDGHILIDTEAFDQAGAEPPPDARPKCGVYLLKLDGEVAYVGRSTRLQSRLQTHRTSGRAFTEIEIIACDAETAVWLERELIRVLLPVQNRMLYQSAAKTTRRHLEGWT